MNALQVFENEQFNVRTIVDDNGEILFVAKDIAIALDYSEDSKPSRLFASVPEIWKGVKRIHTLGGEQDMLCLTEQQNRLFSYMRENGYLIRCNVHGLSSGI